MTALAVLPLPLPLQAEEKSLSRAEIIAHRGASFDAPENTRASVKLGWKQQADAVEIDVYLTADQQVVVMHDKTPKRYGGPDRPVESMTWNELSQLDVGRWKDARWTGETPPLLADVLAYTPAGKRMFVEIKSGPEIVPYVKAVLAAADQPLEQQTIIAFNPDVIAAVREQMPEHRAYWLVSIKTERRQLTPTAEEVIATARKLNVPGVNLGGPIDQAYVTAILEAGFDCYAWTINDPLRAADLISWGVKGITTDRPAWLAEQLAIPLEQ